MNDKELLELAAKASKTPIDYWNDGSEPYSGGSGFILPNNAIWNPLESDAEAFRLAVKLGMELTLPTRRLEVSGASVWFDGKLIHHMHWMDEDAAESDFMDAARRNIVAVAADVGRAMP